MPTNPLSLKTRGGGAGAGGGGGGVRIQGPGPATPPHGGKCKRVHMRSSSSLNAVCRHLIAFGFHVSHVLVQMPQNRDSEGHAKRHSYSARTMALPGGQNQKWPTSGPGGYITHAAWGVPNTSEWVTKSKVAHRWAHGLHGSTFSKIGILFLCSKVV